MAVFITRKSDEYLIKHYFATVRLSRQHFTKSGYSHGYYRNWAKIELFKILSMFLLSASFITIQSEMIPQSARQYFPIYMSM